MTTDTKEVSMAMNEIKNSPLNTYIDYCRKGQLAYQVCTEDNTPFFYPRVVAPKSGSSKLEWRVSQDKPAYNVAMIDLEEGFRMMSRVEDIASDEVKVGMKVKMRMHPGGEKQAPYPVFVPVGGGK